MFDYYSEVYDAVYFEKDYALEFANIIKIIGTTSASNMSILDLGCGTGKHSVKFAEDGFQVHGIDLSQDMIDIANTRRSLLSPEIQQRLTFSKGDIRNFTLNKKFDVVISLFHVINYLTSDNELSHFFQNASLHCKSEGKLIHDTWNAHAISDESFLPKQKRFTFNDEEIVRYSTYEHDSTRNIVRIFFDFASEKLSPLTTNSWGEEHLVRYFFREDLERLSNGFFHLVDIVDEYTLEPISKVNWSALYIYNHHSVPDRAKSNT
jgi:2-polyprenyl-3-methyl-5-hydroxy-6-metoxy-1,4-benzoquinol methylase